MATIKAKFSFDNNEDLTKVYEGYHDPETTWNGWACPAFSREVTERIIQDQKDAMPRDTWEFFKGKFLLWHDADNDTVDIFTPHIVFDENGKELLAWPVGSMMWTWTVQEEQAPEEIANKRFFWKDKSGRGESCQASGADVFIDPEFEEEQEEVREYLQRAEVGDEFEARTSRLIRIA